MANRTDFKAQFDRQVLKQVTNVETGAVYQLTRYLGRGGFGTVFQGHDQTGMEYAVKLMPLAVSASANTASALREAERDAADNTADFLRESTAFRLLSAGPACNMFIVCLYDAFEGTDAETGLPIAVMVYELMDGDIAHGRVSDADIPVLIKSTLEGLNYIHQNGLAHNDLKPGNILRKDSHYKITDLGLACTREAESQELDGNIPTCTSGGTPQYVSPQTAESWARPISLAEAQKEDVWGLGIVFYEIVFGKYPFPQLFRGGRNPFIASPEQSLAFLRNLQQQDIDTLIPQNTPYPRSEPSDISGSVIINLIHQMLAVNPQERPNVDALLNYFNQNIRIPSAGSIRPVSPLRSPKVGTPQRPNSIPEPIAIPLSAAAVGAQGVSGFTNIPPPPGFSRPLGQPWSVDSRGQLRPNIPSYYRDSWSSVSSIYGVGADLPGQTHSIPVSRIKSLPTNGIPTNGIPTNGIPTNGIPTNGIPTNGIPTNGIPTNGIPVVPGTVDSLGYRGSLPPSLGSAKSNYSRLARTPLPYNPAIDRPIPYVYTTPVRLVSPVQPARTSLPVVPISSVAPVSLQETAMTVASPVYQGYRGSERSNYSWLAQTPLQSSRLPVAAVAPTAAAGPSLMDNVRNFFSLRSLQSPSRSSGNAIYRARDIYMKLQEATQATLDEEDLVATGQLEVPNMKAASDFLAEAQSLYQSGPTDKAYFDNMRNDLYRDIERLNSIPVVEDNIRLLLTQDRKLREDLQMIQYMDAIVQ